MSFLTSHPDPTCRLRRAVTLSVGIECEHGYDVCPMCDPCTCGSPRKGESIGEFVRRRADEELHASLISDANDLIQQSHDFRPRIDSGERWIYVQAQIDAIQDDRSRALGVPLRRVTVEFNADGDPYAYLEPLPPLK